MHCSASGLRALRQRFFGVIFQGLSALALTAGLAGCSGGHAPTLTLEAAQTDEFFIPDALETAGRQFFGARRGPAAAPGGLLNGIGRDTLTSGSGTPYARTMTRSLALGLAAERPLGRNLSLVGRVQAARGQSRYSLPQGAGVLVDPITVRFSGVALDAGGGLALHTARTRRWGAQAEVGAGVAAARVKTQISSALLDVRSRSTTRAGYVYVGFGARYTPERGPAVHLGGRVKYYPTEGAAPQAVLRLMF